MTKADKEGQKNQKIKAEVLGIGHRDMGPSLLLLKGRPAVEGVTLELQQV